MAFLDFRLPTRVEAGFSAIPTHKTRIKTLVGGNEKRNAGWTGSKRRYTSAYAGFNRAERAELLNAAEATDGMVYAFRFKDWNDFRVELQTLGVAPAGSTPIQLIKTYTFGPRTKTRTITKPVTATVVVYENDVLKPGSTSSLTGLFTPTDPWTPAAVISATFDFDVPVRFATDEIEFVLPHKDICQVKCELVEVFNE
ncbi:DUF2460 domain-containing protein [Pseudoxanthomonas sacheonensis]|uniref:DUF2460 domain-containing protein n=1 Tax=Pseudoxanthomonas sacheonensis TaxID=443615 RepID=UPI0013D27951|nr:DUF2460 domain-containing protein [Pseudoxanthomonas sacheonensis]KAF1706294.1 glycoside hydrolase family 24 [Pseudoxanthomonas sacheonensis]